MKKMEKIDFYTLQWFYFAEKIVWRAGDSPVSYQRSMRLSIHNDSKRGELQKISVHEKQPVRYSRNNSLQDSSKFLMFDQCVTNKNYAV